MFADFEQADYAPWQVAGEAFGKLPAIRALDGQMAIEGYKGKGFVSSFNGGDQAVGKLTSPSFTIDRSYLTFLIGGGAWKGETAMNLIVDGEIVRSATGSNYKDGGSENLAPASWDVSELVGKEAKLTIVDARQGGWGHINIDHIVLTDDRGDIGTANEGFVPPAQVSRELTVTSDFLQIPLLKNPDRGNPDFQKLSILSEGKVVRFMHVSIPEKKEQADIWYSIDLRKLKGKEITLQYTSTNEQVLEMLYLDDEEKIDPAAYSGPHRPRFHFSPRLGWMNDVNGLYYHDGLYHLFYQYNPTATSYGPGFDMHWGHSVSKDLMHWEEWPIALFPNAAGQCFSGTALMQEHAIPGLNEGSELPAPVLFFTGTEPFTQHIATTSDGGRTWDRFSENPVVPKFGHSDRDPKVIWHEASQHYVMVLYVDGQGDSYRFLRSKDLKEWETTSEIPNWFECPEFFSVTSPTTGEELMLLYGCYRSGGENPVHFNSCYQLGRFDGKTFKPVTEIRQAHQGSNFYGAIIFANDPKNRRIMMGWGQNTRFPDEPFNQCASVPLEMILKEINGEDTLCYEPVAEVAAQRGEAILELKNVSIAEANDKLAELKKDAELDVVIRFRHDASAAAAGVKIRGIGFAYNPKKKTLRQNGRSAPIHAEGILEARFLIDRGMVEAFWNGGEAAYAISSLHTDDGPALKLEGDATIEEIKIYPMGNIWTEK